MISFSRANHHAWPQLFPSHFRRRPTEGGKTEPDCAFPAAAPGLVPELPDGQYRAEQDLGPLNYLRLQIPEVRPPKIHGSSLLAPPLPQQKGKVRKLKLGKKPLPLRAFHMRREPRGPLRQSGRARVPSQISAVSYMRRRGQIGSCHPPQTTRADEYGPVIDYREAFPPALLPIKVAIVVVVADPCCPWWQSGVITRTTTTTTPRQTGNGLNIFSHQLAGFRVLWYHHNVSVLPCDLLDAAHRNPA